MPARLVPLTAGSVPVVSLQRPVLLVGRHPECDVRFDLPSISRRHCCLAIAYDRLTIRDLGSLHGVWINGIRREEAHLKPGDEIAIGPLLFRFEEDIPAPVATLPAPKPAAQTSPPSLPNMPIPSDTDGDLVPLSELRF